MIPALLFGMFSGLIAFATYAICKKLSLKIAERKKAKFTVKGGENV